VILAGDVGGTKAVIALCDNSGGPVRTPGAASEGVRGATPVRTPGAASEGVRGATPVRVIREAEFPCASYASLAAILDEFLAGPVALDGACFGVAGPVAGGTAKITNLPWTIAEAELSARLGGAPVTLLNDLQATALGVLAMPPEAFATLQAPSAPPPPGATIAVIAPGTGLGEALLVSDRGRYRALPSEGGHADFAPGTDEELALFRFLRGRHGPHVSNERVLSGAGIGALYDFARASRGDSEPRPAWLAKVADRNAAISGAALADRDADSVHAMALFATILGAEAGNMALRAFATGGVVIGGGIPPKILPLLQTGALVERFNAKGRFAPWLRSLAVRVILEPRAALLGAAHHAATHAVPHPQKAP